MFIVIIIVVIVVVVFVVAVSITVCFLYKFCFYYFYIFFLFVFLDSIGVRVKHKTQLVTVCFRYWIRVVTSLTFCRRNTIFKYKKCFSFIYYCDKKIRKKQNQI